MNKPDEIKKGLKCCANEENADFVCGGCPYDSAGSNCGELFSDALALIKQLETQVPRWISVKERLPEQHMQNCLCWCVFENGPPENGFAHVAAWCSHGDNGYVNGSHFINEGYCGMHVTHWMPIPEAPKEDS